MSIDLKEFVLTLSTATYLLVVGDAKPQGGLKGKLP